MSNDFLIPFMFEGAGIRSLIKKEDGSFWFVAKDICDVLEIANSRDAISKLEDQDRCVILTDTLNGKQEMTIISEFGLYELILSSQEKNARQFRYWICNEVIPTFLDTDIYSNKEVTVKDISETLYKHYREQESKRLEMERRLKVIESKQEVFPESTVFTVLAYANMIGVAIPVEQVGQLDKKAAALCHAKGFPSDKIKDLRFGMINCYPEKILDEVFRQEFSFN